MLTLLDQSLAIIVTYACGLTIQIPGLLNNLLSQCAISFLTLFGCSIFISVALMHMMPEADEGFKSAGIDQPMTGLFTILGYHLMILVDQFMSDQSTDLTEKDITEEFLRKSLIESPSKKSSQQSQMDKSLNFKSNSMDVKKLNNYQPSNSVKMENDRKMNQLKSSQKDIHKQSMLMRSIDKNGYNAMVSSMLDRRNNQIMSIAEMKHKEPESGVKKEDTSRSAAMILAVGLLVHNIFEGISIGLAPDAAKLLLICVAVCAHKVITAFSLGLSFFKSEWQDSSSQWIMFVFTVAGPTGTLLGFWISADAPIVVQAIMMSLTSGTFLYISMTEVMSVELSKVENKLVKIFGSLSGFLLFSLFVMLKDGD